ncbi:MAG: hypothetical protein ABIP35_04015 [Ginsengibacter sp.]
MKRIIFFLLIFFTMTLSAQNKKGISLAFTWKKATQLPGINGIPSIGVAGPINGISNDVLIVAGGANFPEGMPWKGGKKFFSDEINVLQKKGDNYVWNNNVKSKLSFPIGYCGTASTSKGIVCVGGENANGISKEVFILSWDAKNNAVRLQMLPSLPDALTNVAAASIGNIVYIAGGDEKNKSSNRFMCLDISDTNENWNVLPDLPFEMANTSLIAQGKKLYLIGGRTKTASGISELHHTTFVYDLDKKAWEDLANICDGKNISNLSAAASIAIDKNYILMIGGDNGETFNKIETYISQIASAATTEEKDKLTKEKNTLITEHKGFSKKILLYNIQSDCWIKAGTYPYPAQVTTTAVNWNGEILISNGEIKPGVRTPDIIVGKIK